MSKVNKDIWNREKDGNNRETRSFLRYFIIASALCLILLFIKKDGLIRMFGAWISASRQQKQIEYYQNEIRKLDDQIDVLSNDRDTLETFAREQYNFAEENDDVYLLEER